MFCRNTYWLNMSTTRFYKVELTRNGLNVKKGILVKFLKNE